MSSLQSFALGPIQALMNHYIHLDPDVAALLEPLKDKTVTIELNGLPIHFSMMFTEREIQLLRDIPEIPSVRISGSPFALMKLMHQKKGSPGSVSIKGDIHVAEDFGRLFEELDIDWEEHLSGIIGDVPARLLANCFRSFNQWCKQTCTTLMKNTSEYIQEEARYTPPKEELNDFLNDVDNLRNDVARLAHRVERLNKGEDSVG